MAVRFKARSSSTLGSSIQRSISSIRSVVRNQWVAKQNELFSLTESEGVSYAEQIKFMKQWLGEMKTAPFSDKDMIAQVKKDIASTKKLQKWQGYRDKYYVSYDALKTGKASWDQHIDFLENELETTQDPSLRDDIQAKLSTARAGSRNSYNNMIDNRVVLAQTDKSRVALSEAIEIVQSERRESMLGGDEERLSVLDIKLQLLQNDLNAVDVEDALHLIDNLGLDGKSPIEKLNVLRDRFVGATDTGSFVYNNTRYSSQKEFWKATMGDYVVGSFGSELKEYYNKKNTNYLREFGTKDSNSLPESLLMNDVKDMDTLINDPVLADYNVSIVNAAQGVKIDSVGAYLNDVSDTMTREQTTLAGTDYLTKLGKAEILSGLNLEKERSTVSASLGQDVLAASAEAAQAIQQYMVEYGMGYDQAKKIVFENIRVPDVGLGEALEKGVGKTAEALATAPTLADVEGGGFSKEQLDASYRKILGRDADPVGLRDFGSSKWAGKSVQELEQALTDSDEFRAKKPTAPITTQRAPVPKTTDTKPVQTGDFDQNANTLYNFYKTKLPSRQERAQKFNEFGLGEISAYVGTADQNNQLLSKLKGI